MFSIKEQKGLFVLVVLITITLLSKYLTRQKEADYIETPVANKKIEVTPITPYLLIKNQDTLLKSKQISNNSIAQAKKTKSNPAKSFSEFDFNPNTISFDSLILLGVNKRAAYNWTKYMSKGGKFKIKDDIKKIYGLKENDFFRIKSHILLPDSIRSEKSIAYQKPYKKKHFIQKNYNIELNTCTAEDLKKLNGIGEKLSKRIIKFRNKLGGFYSVTQVKEVYGLPIETYEKIKRNLTVDKNKIKKIKINFEEKNALIGFPYFNYRLAVQLYNYRKQHGYFKGIDDLKKMKTMDSTKIRKIEPYLDFALN